MIPIPTVLLARFEEFLSEKDIPGRYHIYYKKWLRFYLDFCAKYNVEPLRARALTLFCINPGKKDKAKCSNDRHHMPFQCITISFMARSVRLLACFFPWADRGCRRRYAHSRRRKADITGRTCDDNHVMSH